MSHALRSNCLRFGAKGNSPTALSPALQVWSSRGRSGFSRVRLGQPAPSFTHPILIVTTRASHCRAAWGIPEAQYVLGMAKSRKGDAPGQGKPRGAGVSAQKPLSRLLNARLSQLCQKFRERLWSHRKPSPTCFLSRGLLRRGSRV